MEKIRIGTRGSRLALAQARLVQEALIQADASLKTELVILQTKGDRILDKPLAEIGDKGLFASELEQALLEGKLDLAVHSAKDLPVRLAKGLTIGAVLKRADVRDVLVVKKGAPLPEAVGKLPETETDGDAGRRPEPFVLGTGSKRRQAQAQLCWRNTRCELIRGNVETRLKKLADGGYDGILLAKAGLDRLGIGAGTEPAFDFHVLPAELFLPAACQGIIAVEAAEDSPVRDLLAKITDGETWLQFQTEREVLAQLGADCSEAAAAWCRMQQDQLLLDVMYGKERVSLSAKGTGADGIALAEAGAANVRKAIFQKGGPDTDAADGV
ncbi:MAG: hydroxymethylbilane synthase [Eubacteriales bacterium]|nr:hydroxymethylbilane synthase [Eubacteriales bacterium]